MNSVNLIGRLTADPNFKQGEETKNSFARFNIAIDRGKSRDGQDMGADFPSIVCFGRTAELVNKYLGKGRLVGVMGRIQTGSYEKDGQKVYTTDVLADRVQFLDKSDDGAEFKSDGNKYLKPSEGDIQVEGFSKMEDDIPF